MLSPLSYYYYYFFFDEGKEIAIAIYLPINLTIIEGGLKDNNVRKLEKSRKEFRLRV